MNITDNIFQKMCIQIEVFKFDQYIQCLKIGTETRTRNVTNFK